MDARKCCPLGFDSEGFFEELLANVDFCILLGMVLMDAKTRKEQKRPEKDLTFKRSRVSPDRPACLELLTLYRARMNLSCVDES
jgi:hypothetical protein